jgi:hypothetical protein
VCKTRPILPITGITIKKTKNLARDFFSDVQFYRRRCRRHCRHHDDDVGVGSIGIHHQVANYRKALIMMHIKSHKMSQFDIQTQLDILAHHYNSQHHHHHHLHSSRGTGGGGQPRGLERLIIQEESGKRAKRHFASCIKSTKAKSSTTTTT